ncbi:MAG: hypothetical protein IIW66_06360, partial [Bacteroidales bacterium]|nr:hypothetical protein [Bacteroidales bacterium]
AIISAYVSDIVGNGYMTRTSWYFGQLGGHPLNTSWTGANKYGFGISNGNITLRTGSNGELKGNTTRCVKDIRVN